MQAQNNLQNLQIIYCADRIQQSQADQLTLYVEKVNSFVQKNRDQCIFFMTSGGTSVPLQKNTVRTLQNFSTGTRGSILAQHILQQNHPLVFFYRDNSFLPYTSGITVHNCMLDQSEQNISKMSKARQKLKIHKEKLLLLPFKSIYMYLNGISMIKNRLPRYSILILCAAVSDFIPESVAEHKIQTASKLSIDLVSSPKILGEMKSNQRLIISFKLQTDKSILEQKMQASIEKYGSDLVVGNLLGNKVWAVIKYNSQTFANTQDKQIHGSVQQDIIREALHKRKLKFSL